MPTPDRLLERLTEILAKQLRGHGRHALQTWVDQCDESTGDLLVLRAPITGQAIVEAGFQSAVIARLI